MSEADRRHLLSSVNAGADAEMSSSGVNSLSDGFADAYAGVRNLISAGTVTYDEKENDQDEARRVYTEGWRRVLLLGIGIFLVAAAARVAAMALVTGLDYRGVGWYTDTFHHWQIGYLSKEIGFSQGFLRLWDFKGMEYFWGALHPLVLAGLFAITGSVDIMVPRALGLVCGSVAIVLLFFILRRYFGTHAAIAGAVIATLNPISLAGDTSGMQEPLGIMLLFAALLLWRRQALGSGVLLGLAGLVRAEYWLFGAGLVVAALLTEDDKRAKQRLILGWGLITIIYLKYLWDKTGNPIYPVYWNFLANAAGQWIADVKLSQSQLAVQWTSRGVAIVGLIAGSLVIWKKPRYALLLLLGIGNFIYLAAVFGFTEYVRGYIPRVLVDRIMILSAIYIGVIVSTALFHWLPNRIPQNSRRILRILAWGVLAGIVFASQFLWAPILEYSDSWGKTWEAQRDIVATIGELHSDGVVSIPAGRPDLTYFLVRDQGLRASQIEGQMYDPFAYLGDEPFDDSDAIERALKDWLVGRNIRLLVTNQDNQNYQEMIGRFPDWFESAGDSPNREFQFYRVRIDL